MFRRIEIPSLTVPGHVQDQSLPHYKIPPTFEDCCRRSNTRYYEK
jgi:hypothetical protein